MNHFSLFERTVFYGLCTVLVLSAGSIALNFNSRFTVEVPVSGGALHEGVIGSARFINPVLAISDSDRDLTALIYSGLMRQSQNGALIPDLAQSYSISDDGKTYDFILKKDLTFHDGTPLTSDDIEFTIQKIQDPTIKSPKRANWDSVSVEKVSPLEIKFILRQAYSPFLQNTTVGILPKHLWKDISPEEIPFSLFNVEPIGSGPYKVDSITRDTSGLPTSYSLSPFTRFALGTAYLKNIVFSFFPNQEALLGAYKSGDIAAIHSVQSEELQPLSKISKQIVTTPLPRIFGVFFNQSENPLFTDQKIRQALDAAVDREGLVKMILGGYGVADRSPLPPLLSSATTTSPMSEEEHIAAARNILTGAGWVYNENTHIFEKTVKKGKNQTTTPLAFSLSTGDAPELKATAEALKSTWQKVGIAVDVKIFEAGDLNQNVIRPRKYDALLFGEIIGPDLDLFAFWHSSQRNDPGLNIAMYTNSKTDKLLEDARIMNNRDDRIEKYQQFAEIVASETPAIFLYSPDFIYLLPPAMRGVNINNMTIPSERFSNVYEWYVDSERVWKFLVK